jgi:hypothetical protein
MSSCLFLRRRRSSSSCLEGRNKTLPPARASIEMAQTRESFRHLEIPVECASEQIQVLSASGSLIIIHLSDFVIGFYENAGDS